MLERSSIELFDPVCILVISKKIDKLAIMAIASSSTENIIDQSSFQLEIKFDNSSNPSSAFRTMSEILDALNEVDENLISSIDSEIKPVTLLEDLQKGSIKGWFKNAIQAIPDEGLKELDWKKAVGHYLVKGKYIIIKFLENKTEITSRDEIKSLESQLYQLAKETDVKKFPSYSPIPTAKLVGSIRKISNSLQYAKKGETVVFSGSSIEESASFNMEFNFSPESLEDLLTKEQLSSEQVMILKVKKPDYLGDSKWELRHEKTTIYAKIIDEEWLTQFQERKINVRPGDSLKAKVRITVNYDYNNEVIGTHYEIVEISEIIAAETGNQLDLFESV